MLLFFLFFLNVLKASPPKIRLSLRSCVGVFSTKPGATALRCVSLCWGRLCSECQPAFLIQRKRRGAGGLKRFPANLRETEQSRMGIVCPPPLSFPSQKSAIPPSGENSNGRREKKHPPPKKNKAIREPPRNKT